MENRILCWFHIHATPFQPKKEYIRSHWMDLSVAAQQMEPKIIFFLKWGLNYLLRHLLHIIGHSHWLLTIHSIGLLLHLIHPFNFFSGEGKRKATWLLHSPLHLWCSILWLTKAWHVRPVHHGLGWLAHRSHRGGWSGWTGRRSSSPLDRRAEKKSQFDGLPSLRSFLFILTRQS